MLPLYIELLFIKKSALWWILWIFSFFVCYQFIWSILEKRSFAVLLLELGDTLVLHLNIQASVWIYWVHDFFWIFEGDIWILWFNRTDLRFSHHLLLDNLIIDLKSLVNKIMVFFKPRMQESLLARKSLLRIWINEAEKKIFSIFRELWKCWCHMR